MVVSLPIVAWTVVTLNHFIVTSATAVCDADQPQSIDGTCNNVMNPSFGASFTPYSRGAEGAEYEDGIKLPVTDRPNPRTISNLVGAEDPVTAEEDPIPHSMMAVMFGQFINHDFESNDKEKLFVCPSEDPSVFATDLLVPDPNDDLCYLEPNVNRCDPNNGPFFIVYRPSAGSISSVSGQFEVDNRGTSYLDLSPIYGNNDVNATVLRTLKGGALLTGDYSGTLQFGPVLSQDWNITNLPPSRTKTGLNTDTTNFGLNQDLVLTHGDFRLNINVALAGFHTLFLREHNRLAKQYREENPGASDEDIYQQARRRNIAQYQKIILEDYLPAQFGAYFTNIVGPYRGYDDSVDATTGAAFAGAAFRYGHSTIRGYAPLNACGNTSPFLPPGGELPFIGQTGGPFSIPELLVLSGNDGFETIMRGLVATRTRPVDTKVDDGVRIIKTPDSRDVGFIGVDLLAIDLQRGRINGVPNYDRLRAAYHPKGSMYGSRGCGAGLAKKRKDPLRCFIRFVSGPPRQATTEEKTLATNLRNLYGKINKIDGLIGMLAERKRRGTSFGQTLGRIVADQYKRARDGDRFWYENVLSPEEQVEVKSVTLKTLLKRNFELKHLPDDVFFAPADFAGDLASKCPV